MAVSSEGDPIGTGFSTSMNFEGSGVIATDGGGGLANILIQGGTNVLSNGSDPGGNPFLLVNFAGGLQAVNSGGSTATVSISQAQAIPVLNIGGTGDFGPGGPKSP